MDNELTKVLKASRDNFNFVKKLMENEDIDGEFSLRVITSYVLIVIHHHESISDLIEKGNHISSFALIRPLVEAYIRATWLTINEDSTQVNKTLEALKRGKDRFPPNSDMFDMIDEKFGEETLTIMVKDEMRVLNDFTHGGNILLSRCLSGDIFAPNFPEEELITTLKGITFYMLLSVLAYASKTDNKKLADSISEKIIDLTK